MTMFSSFIYVIFYLNVVQCFDMTQFLTSSYSQVSRSGSNSNNQNEARSNVGQRPWTHSSDVHIVRGQNLPIFRKPNYKDLVLKKDDHKYYDDNVPGRGEVIQERFQPKPYFGYEEPKRPVFKKNKPANPDFTINVPFDSFPLQLRPSESKPAPVLKPPSGQPPDDSDSGPPASLDDSNSNVNIDSGQMDNDAPIDIYNSPSSDDSDNNQPFNSMNPNNYVTPSSFNGNLNQYLPPPPPKKPTKPSKYPNMDMNKPPDYDSNMHMYGSDSNMDKPQMPPEMDKPPKDMDNDEDSGPPITHSFHHPSPGYLDHPPPMKYHHTTETKDEDEPPKLHDHSKFPKLPEYLDHDPSIKGHNFEHYFPYDHHPPIYHEIKTTTEAAEEDQRLSKRPYSYYYIGRKLWYIPLYFSVYFVVYIFVLIIKSIARHKITFNHYFEEDKREMKDMHDMHDEHVRELGDHIEKNMNYVQRKYMM